jgi:uncharacterized protein
LSHPSRTLKLVKRRIDPQRLDVEVFCRDAGTLDGEWPIAALARLVAAAHPEHPPAADARVAWSLSGELRSGIGGERQHWLGVRAATALDLVCQRCLGPVRAELSVDRRILFVEGEARAEALDAEIDDDVLALTRTLDAQALVEDELLLALPLVPRHERCPQPLAAPVEQTPAGEERPNPFAALRSLKSGGGR